MKDNDKGVLSAIVLFAVNMILIGFGVPAMSAMGIGILAWFVAVVLIVKVSDK